MSSCCLFCERMSSQRKRPACALVWPSPQKTRWAVECVFDQICSFGIYVIRYDMFLCFQVHFRTKQTKCFFAYAMLNIICFNVFMFLGTLQYQTNDGKNSRQKKKGLPLFPRYVGMCRIDTSETYLGKRGSPFFLTWEFFPSFIWYYWSIPNIN